MGCASRHSGRTRMKRGAPPAKRATPPAISATPPAVFRDAEITGDAPHLAGEGGKAAGGAPQIIEPTPRRMGGRRADVSWTELTECTEFNSDNSVNSV